MYKSVLIVSPKQAGSKLRDVLLDLQLPSSKQARKLIDAGSVFVNGEMVCFGSRIVQKGDEIIVVPPARHQTPRSISILFEDDDLIALSKPAFCVSSIESLVQLNPSLSHCEMVHRLDKETSGVLLLAKNTSMKESLETLFHKKCIQKTYVALVAGRPKTSHGVIAMALSLKKKIGNQVVWQADPKSRLYAETDYFVQGCGRDVSFVRLTPKTGRTHQIRVHMASIGCPIVGDKVYGRRSALPGVHRHMLHASSVSFEHPITKQPCVIKAPLPDDFIEVLQSYVSSRAKELICEYS